MVGAIGRRVGGPLGHADRRGHHDRVDAGHARDAHAVDQPLSDDQDLGFAVRSDQHHELVTCQARRGIAVADGRPQQVGDLDEHLVALVMAERVVDRLEAIEVDEQQCTGVAATQQLVEPGAEELPVRQPGQSVVRRLEPQLRA